MTSRMSRACPKMQRMQGNLFLACWAGLRVFCHRVGGISLVERKNSTLDPGVLQETLGNFFPHKGTLVVESERDKTNKQKFNMLRDTSRWRKPFKLLALKSKLQDDLCLAMRFLTGEGLKVKGVIGSLLGEERVPMKSMM